MRNLRYFFQIAFFFSLFFLLSGCQLVIFEPKGLVALDEKNLLITAILLMLIIVIPVILMTWVFAWRYRASNLKATYQPDWGHSNLIEIVCWSVPCIIIAILATITWISSHQLDPYHPLTDSRKPITIQVIALDWKWLFIYPEQNIATVNYLQLPVNEPVKFLITADAPMNSFQIPQLAGQIYAMAGMQTKLNLIANQTGDYKGFSSNFSGQGFSGMSFKVKVTSLDQFNDWAKKIALNSPKLSLENYPQLVKPSENDPPQNYVLQDADLFSNVVMAYMMPMPMSSMTGMATMSKQ